MVIESKMINSGKEFGIHRAAQGSLFTSMEFKEVPQTQIPILSFAAWK